MPDKPSRIFYFTCSALLSLLVPGWLLITGCADDLEITVPTSDLYSQVEGNVSPSYAEPVVYLIEIDIFDSSNVDENTGQFTMDSVPYGEYILQIEAQGYGIVKKTVFINSAFESLGSFYLSSRPSQVSNISPSTSTLLDKDYLARNISTLTDTSIIFTVSFTDNMDSASLIEALEFEPEERHINPVISYESDISSSDFELHIEIPKVDLLKYETLKITLGEHTETVFGEKIDFAYTMSYSIDSANSSILTQSLIHNVSPRDNEYGVSVYKNLSISFTEAMDKKSAENAFYIEPDLPANFFWYDYSGSTQSLRIEFVKPFAYSTSYTYGLTGGVCTLENQCTQTNFSVQFFTADLFMNTYKPYNGVSEFPLDSVFYFRFNQTVDVSLFETSFTITPEVDSLTFKEYSNSSIVVLHALLEKNTQYTITLDSTLTGSTRENSGDFLTINFETGSEILGTSSIISSQISTSPKDTVSPIATNSEIYVHFPDSVNKESVTSRFSISPPISTDLNWTSYSSSYEISLHINPTHRLKAGSVYSITLDSGFQNIEGETYDKFTFNVKTQPLKLEYYSPPIGRINVGLDDYLIFDFNSTVDSTSFIRNFSITPAISDIELIYSNSKTTISVSHDSFRSGTDYIMTLDGGVSDTYGAELSARYDIEFSTVE